MEQIKLYLKKFENLVPRERQVRDAVIEIITKYTECTVSPEAIHIRGSTILITADPSLKNVLFLYKKEIILGVTEKMGMRRSVKDLR